MSISFSEPQEDREVCLRERNVSQFIRALAYAGRIEPFVIDPAPTYGGPPSGGAALEIVDRERRREPVQGIGPKLRGTPK